MVSWQSTENDPEMFFGMFSISLLISFAVMNLDKVCLNHLLCIPF